MPDTLTINGTAINLVATNTNLDTLTPFVKGGVPELHFNRILGPLATLPDPWSGKAATLQLAATGSTVVFAGDVVGYVDRWMESIGWVREYRAIGRANRAAHTPVTDSNTLTDTSVWDLPGDDPNFIGARAGQTVGQIVQQVLQMATNAAPLYNAGIGNWAATGGPWTLPTATVNDLAALTVIPPWRATVAGERLLASIEQFIQSCHPNHWLHVQPDGTIRVLDSRTFAANTLTLGADPRIGMPQLTRDHSDCYSQVLVRGNTLVKASVVETLPWSGSSASDGGLAEDFAWGSYTNSAAKANWKPTDWSQPNAGIGSPLAAGSCTCTDTTHVVINTSLTFTANQLGQASGELLGQIQLFSDALGGSVSQITQARIVSNTATSGGSCTVTLDTTLPATSYNAYKIFGLNAGANAVGRRYKVTNAAIAGAILTSFPYPVPYVAATGEAGAMISSPMGIICFNATGGTAQPWNTASLGLTVDPSSGHVYFDMPTQVAAYGLNTPVRWPANVQAILPVAYGTLTAYAPSSTTYAGTLSTVEGVHRTKTITVLEWRDYSNQANMQTFASEFLDSVKDVVVEGTVPYNGLPTAYLTPGQAVNIAGSGYTTGWESLALPVVSVEVAFQSAGSGTSYLTTLHLSNRRGRYSSENFLRPNVTGLQLGTGEGGETIAAGGPQFYGSGTTAGQQAEGQQRQQQAEAQQQYRERYQNDPEFREQADRQAAREASASPWDRAAGGLDAAYGGGGGADAAYGQAAGGLDAAYGGSGGADAAYGGAAGGLGEMYDAANGKAPDREAE